MKRFRQHMHRTPRMHGIAHIHGGLIPLGSVPTAARAVMREVRGGSCFTARVVALGFTPGAEVTVIQNYGHGPIMVEVRQSRVALGRGEAHKIWVEVLPEA